MGVPGLATWLRQRYPEAFRELPPNASFDNVYVDLQSTLHMVTRKAYNRSGFHILLHRRLDDMLSQFSPTRRLVLAMDGPAPLAKLLEQRRRRRRESERSLAAETEAAAAAALEGGGSAGGRPDRRGGKAAASSGVSPLSLTTGTVFMLEVHNSLVYYICHRLSDPRHRHLEFELSDSTVKGEGELKILSRLLHANVTTLGDTGGAPEVVTRRLSQEEAWEAAGNLDVRTEGSTTAINSSGGSGNVSESDGSDSVAAGEAGESHVIVGGDSDLLLMAIISGQKHVSLWNDGIESRRRPDSALFDRDRLEAAWKKDHLPPGASSLDVVDLGLNLALLAMICSGNDYLPGCPGLSLQNKFRPGLWSLFLDMRRQPEWEGRSLVIRQCAGCDNTGDTASTNASDSICPGGLAVAVDRPMLAALLQRYQDQRCWATHLVQGGGGNRWHNIRAFQGAWEYRPKGAPPFGTAVPLPLPPFQDQPWRQAADPEAYIHGLEWVLSMYSTAGISDYRFAYPRQAPTVPVFLEHLTSLAPPSDPATLPSTAQPTPPEQQTPKRRFADVLNRQPLIPAACALALLPARSRRQAATPLRHLMDADSPVAEIYAVCGECQQLGKELRGLNGELDVVRREIAALQAKLVGAGPDADGAVDAEGSLAGATARFEAAQDKLKAMLSELSKTQYEHLRAKHPFKPFPTSTLEAAVREVPAERYPHRERRLARFGREMVFRSTSGSVDLPTPSIDDDQQRQEQLNINAAAAAAVTATPPLSPPLPSLQSPEFRDQPSWIKDASTFAAAYPRATSQRHLREAAAVVQRQLLPLHPYMQPGLVLKRGSAEPPRSQHMTCQLRRHFSSSLSTPAPRALHSSFYSFDHQRPQLLSSSFMGGERGVSGLHSVRMGPRRFTCAAFKGQAMAAEAPATRMPSNAAGGVPQRSRVARAALTACARVLPFFRVL